MRSIPGKTATADLPRLEHRETQSLSAGEARRLIAAARNEKLGIVFIFNLLTGCRPSESFRLRKGGGHYFDKPRTRNSRRVVRLLPGLVEDLKRHRASQVESLLKIGVRSELSLPERNQKRSVN